MRYVILVDDDTAFASDVRRSLVGQFAVHDYRHGEEALAEMNRRWIASAGDDVPACVLLDVYTPRRNALTLGVLLQQNPRWSVIPQALVSKVPLGDDEGVYPWAVTVDPNCIDGHRLAADIELAIARSVIGDA